MPDDLADLAEKEERAKAAFAEFQSELRHGAPLNSPTTIWKAIDLLTRRAEYAEAALTDLTTRLGDLAGMLAELKADSDGDELDPRPDETV